MNNRENERRDLWLHGVQAGAEEGGMIGGECGESLEDGMVPRVRHREHLQ